jgi:hypothetical protein
MKELKGKEITITRSESNMLTVGKNYMVDDVLGNNLLSVTNDDGEPFLFDVTSGYFGYEVVNKLDEILKQLIVEYADGRGGWLTEAQIQAALKGVKHWFQETVNDSISTALNEVLGDEAFK